LRQDLPDSKNDCAKTFVFKNKPIIGIVGGIGSGKSYVASLFGELGCMVIHSDDQVREAYADPRVRMRLREWWGDRVLDSSGGVNRSAIAEIIFRDEGERKKLEQLLHPLVAKRRDELMASAPDSVVAFVWDTPLLAETGLDKVCDAIVFVDAPQEVRLARVAGRGWPAEELLRREILQMPLDKKRGISHYVLDNSAEGLPCVADVPKVTGTEQVGVAATAVDSAVRGQVREILSRILDRGASTGITPRN
jgi:dephospho-CoA kinase